jgi:hypothetical protein
MSRLASVVLFLSTLAHAEGEAPPSPKQVVLVRVGLSTVSPSGGVAYERWLAPHLTVLLGADGELYRDGTFSRDGISGELGARWYFGQTPLSGAWLGLSVPLGLSQHTTESGIGALGGLSGLGGLGGLGGLAPTTAVTTSAFIGARLLLGWTFRFDNGLTLQAAAGPTGTVSQSTVFVVPAPAVSQPFQPPPSFSGRLGLMASVALGAAF